MPAPAGSGSPAFLLEGEQTRLPAAVPTGPVLRAEIKEAPCGPGSSGYCLPGLILDLAFQAQKHNLTVNLTTFRVWCYACEKEVFPEQRLAAPLPAASPRLFEQVWGAVGSLWLVTRVEGVAV